MYVCTVVVVVAVPLSKELYLYSSSPLNCINGGLALARKVNAKLVMHLQQCAGNKCNEQLKITFVA